MIQVVEKLASHNVTDIFVDCFNNGVTYFPSATMRDVGGMESQGPDLIGAALQAAKGRVNIHAWLEYGLIAQYGTKATVPFARNASEQGWILGAANGFLWMDGRIEGVQKWLCGVIRDASDAHPDLASIQLDDHFALPASLVGASIPNQQSMTTLAESLSTCAHAVDLALSPATLSFAKSALNVDWALWLASPVSVPFGMYYPQIYRSTFSAFELEYNHTLDVVSNVGDRWIPGIRVLGSGAPTPWTDVHLMLNRAEEHGGVVVWYAAGILDSYAEQFCEVWGCDRGVSVDACSACRMCVTSGGNDDCSIACAFCNQRNVIV
jgi:uncharacterized lipoprotein YddW (UPF0748 family)